MVEPQNVALVAFLQVLVKHFDVDVSQVRNFLQMHLLQTVLLANGEHLPFQRRSVELADFLLVGLLRVARRREAFNYVGIACRYDNQNIPL